MALSRSPRSSRIPQGPRSWVDFWLGVLLCAWAASLFSIFYHESVAPQILPLVFVALIVWVSRAFGMMAGVVGCVAITLIFSLFAYHPLGSINVADDRARANLVWMIIVSLSLARFLLPYPKRRNDGED